MLCFVLVNSVLFVLPFLCLDLKTDQFGFIRLFKESKQCAFTLQDTRRSTETDQAELSTLA